MAKSIIQTAHAMSPKKGDQTVKAEEVQTKARRRAEETLGELNVPLAFMSRLVRDQTCVAFRKGEAVFLQGSTADVLYWVVSGLVKVYCPAPDGGHVLVRMAGPGDFIGFIDTKDSEGRRVQAFEARAMTKSDVAIFTRDRMRTLLKTLNTENSISLIEEINRGWGAFCRSWIVFQVFLCVDAFNQLYRTWLFASALTSLVAFF